MIRVVGNSHINLFFTDELLRMCWYAHCWRTSYHLWPCFHIEIILCSYIHWPRLFTSFVTTDKMLAGISYTSCAHKYGFWLISFKVALMYLPHLHCLCESPELHWLCCVACQFNSIVGGYLLWHNERIFCGGPIVAYLMMVFPFSLFKAIMEVSDRFLKVNES